MSSLNSSQQRLMQVINLLGNDVVNGYAPSQLAAALGVAQSYISRDLDNLLAEQWVIKNEQTGHWIIGPKIIAIAVKGIKAVDDAQRRLDSIRNRFTT
jgi:DNA-binding IclR family transcriptional regulator